MDKLKELLLTTNSNCVVTEKKINQIIGWINKYEETLISLKKIYDFNENQDGKKR